MEVPPGWFSFEYFPPKTPEGVENLRKRIATWQSMLASRLLIVPGTVRATAERCMLNQSISQNPRRGEDEVVGPLFHRLHLGRGRLHVRADSEVDFRSHSVGKERQESSASALPLSDSATLASVKQKIHMQTRKRCCCELKHQRECATCSTALHVRG